MKESATTTKDARKQIKVLDYAAGTGNVSQALASYVTRTLGVDISKGMVETYNKKVMLFVSLSFLSCSLKTQIKKSIRNKLCLVYPFNKTKGNNTKTHIMRITWEKQNR